MDVHALSLLDAKNRDRAGTCRRDTSQGSDARGGEILPLSRLFRSDAGAVKVAARASNTNTLPHCSPASPVRSSVRTRPSCLAQNMLTAETLVNEEPCTPIRD